MFVANDPFGGNAELVPSYTAAVFLGALREIGWESGEVPATVLYTYARFEVYLATRPDVYTANDMLGTGPGRFFLVNNTDGRVGINCLGTGPSATANQLELQAELGVRNVVLIGTAGGLRADQAPGDLILPTAAVRADGTSDHYAPPGQEARPNSELAAAFEAALEANGLPGDRAPCWTTAAAFRTTAEEIAYYGEQGVRAVEEEVAALFTVGAARNLRTAAALVLDAVPTAARQWRVDFAAAQGTLQALFAATVDFASSL